MLQMEPAGTKAIQWKPIKNLRTRPKQIPNKQWALAQETIVHTAENCSPTDIQKICSCEVRTLLTESNPTPEDISLLSSHMFAQRTFELCVESILANDGFAHLDDDDKSQVQEHVLDVSLEMPGAESPIIRIAVDSTEEEFPNHLEQNFQPLTQQAQVFVLSKIFGIN